MTTLSPPPDAQLAAADRAAGAPAPAARGWPYALINLAMNVPSQAFSVLLLFFYTDVKGLPASWAAAALTVYAVYNALNNPLIGLLSDRTRTRWGRRVPFLRFGGLPWMLVFALLWVPPFDGTTQPLALLAYFVVLIALYDALGTAVSTAYYALLPELFPAHAARTAVAVQMNLVQTVGLIVGVALAPLLAERLGYGMMGVAFAALSAGAIYLGLRGIAEPPAAAPPAAMALPAVMAATFGNRSFLTVVAAQTMRYTAISTLAAGTAFFLTYTLGADAEQAALILGTVFIVAGLALAPWRQLIVRRFETRTCLLIAYAALAVAVLPLAFVTSVAGMIATAVGIGVAFSGLILLGDVVLSEVVDEDTARSGQRRAGLFFGASSMLTTLGTALTAVLFGLISAAYGYEAGSAVQPESVGAGFRLFVTVVPAGAALLACLLIWHYPLHGERLRAVRQAAARIGTGEPYNQGKVAGP